MMGEGVSLRKEVKSMRGVMWGSYGSVRGEWGEEE